VPEAAGMDAEIEVVVYLRDFADEQEAIEYAIASQRIRRNLTESEIVRCIVALDKVKKSGERTDLVS
jgi:hypothetical protein